MDIEINRGAEKTLKTVLNALIVIEIIAGIIWSVLSAEQRGGMVIPISATIAAVINTAILSFFAEVLSNISYKLDKKDHLKSSFYALILANEKEKAKEVLLKWLSKDEDFKSLIKEAESKQTEDDSEHLTEADTNQQTYATDNEEEMPYIPSISYINAETILCDKIKDKYTRYFDALGLAFDINKIREIIK